MKLSTPEKKEIELRVAQELKNNHEFIYQTNQALQNLSVGLNAMASMHRTEMAGIGTKHKRLEISFENLAVDINQKVKNAFNKYDDMLSALELKQSMTEKDVKQLYKKKIDREELDMIVEDLIEKQYALDQSHERLSCHLEASKSLIKGQIETSADVLRKDLAKDESLPKQMIEDTRALLAPFYNDFKGLVVEIARLKKEVDYNEKKFEQIYTLIKRLQEASKSVSMDGR